VIPRLVPSIGMQPIPSLSPSARSRLLLRTRTPTLVAVCRSSLVRRFDPPNPPNFVLNNERTTFSSIGTKPIFPSRRSTHVNHRPFMDYLSPGTIVIPGIISNKCWMKRSICLLKQISLLEIISTVVLLAIVVVVVVDLSRVFHC